MRQKYFGQLGAYAGALLCGLGLVCNTTPARSQQQGAPANPVAMPILDKAALQQDAVLQAKISLEAKRMPLRELLAQAQKQSGVVLQATADSPATRSLLTARLKEMTLATLMISLARIYDVRWTKDGTVYTMHGSDNDELSYKLIRYQGIKPAQITTGEQVPREHEDNALAKEIFYSVDEEAWKAPAGVPMSALPQDVQERLLQRFEADGIFAVIVLERLERIFAAQTFYLRLHIASSRTPLFRQDAPGIQDLHMSALHKMPRLMVYNSDDRFVASLFPQFHGPEQPSAFELEFKERLQNRLKKKPDAANTPAPEKRQVNP
ncbi:MAG: hypothetical protein JWN98_1865 [Abditibacteriota bacterium]|nr:hypothetical protein [Abditibacteriota bacterium]